MNVTFVDREQGVLTQSYIKEEDRNRNFPPTLPADRTGSLVILRATIVESRVMYSRYTQ